MIVLCVESPPRSGRYGGTYMIPEEVDVAAKPVVPLVTSSTE